MLHKEVIDMHRKDWSPEFEQAVKRAQDAGSIVSVVGAEIETALKTARRSGSSPQEIEKLRGRLIKMRLEELDSLSGLERS